MFWRRDDGGPTCEEQLAQAQKHIEDLRAMLQHVQTQLARERTERAYLAAQVSKLEAALRDQPPPDNPYPPFPVGTLLDHIARWLTDRPKPGTVELADGTAYASVKVEGELYEVSAGSKREAREQIWRLWLKLLLQGSNTLRDYEDK